ncbi:MAG: hypothetical protein ACYDAG_17745, partial [Chloroflexota bacterium]
QGEELARLVSILCTRNQAPVIVDDGALLDTFGSYSSSIVPMFRALAGQPNAYLGMIHRRRPQSDQLAGLPITVLRLAPLTPESTEVLIQQTFRLAGVQTTPQQVQELAKYVQGYPPAIEMAATYSLLYGLPTLLADKHVLVDLQVRAFLSVLEQLALTETEWGILRVLASEGSLPLEALSTVQEMPAEHLAAPVRNLVDVNLIVPQGDVLSISAPVQYAVEHVRGLLTDAEYRVMAEKLHDRFWSDPQHLPGIHIVDATLHALGRGAPERLVEFHDVMLPADLYRAAKDEYDERHIDSAISLAVRVLESVKALHRVHVIMH